MGSYARIATVIYNSAAVLNMQHEASALCPCKQTPTAVAHKMASTSSKPTIVFAPGSWHTPDCFDLIRDALRKRGWVTDAVSYPTVGAEPPTKGLTDDAAAIRSVIEALSEQGKEVVLVTFIWRPRRCKCGRKLGL